MRFTHASIVLGFFDSSTASPYCTIADLQNVANLNVSAVASFPIAGDCMTALNGTMQVGISSCTSCTAYNLTSDGCRFCYSLGAISAVAREAGLLLISNSSCTSADMVKIANDSCLATPGSLSSCSSISGLSAGCIPCATESIKNHAGDCTSACLNVNENNHTRCYECSQAQYLSAATYCLTVTTSSAFASFGGLMISSLLMVVMIVFGL